MAEPFFLLFLQLVNMNNEVPSWVMGPFIRPKNQNPVLRGDLNSVFQCPVRKKTVHWEALHVFNPAAITFNNKVYLLYRAEDNYGKMKIGRHTSRLGLAESEDGIYFKKSPEPVLFPGNDMQKRFEWPGGCEDPRIVEGENGEFILAYTQKDHFIARLGIATSKDLVHWEKHGQAFHENGHPWISWDTKAASIVCSVVDGHLKATKVNGKYLMYIGVRGIRTATSDDLIHWEPQEWFIKRREGYFDVLIDEAGPPAILTNNGIVLIYNGKNHAERGDTTLSHNLYTGGQMLFDAQHPTKCIGRLDHPFFKPELPFELTGQYVAGVTFLEGLVYFQEKWFMYYGCADSVVGVAIWDPKKNS